MSASGEVPGGKRPGLNWREWLLVAGGYLALTVVYSYPIPFHPGANYSNAIDYNLSYWNLWWVKKAMLELHQSFYTTDYLFYPTGTNLAFHPFSLYNTLQAVVLQLLWAPQVVYNLLFLSSILLSGIGAYALIRYLAGNRTAAFVGGMVYAFTPYHAINYCHTHVFAIQWIPLYALFLIKIAREEQLGNAVLAGLFFFLCTISDWYELVYMLVLTLLFLVFQVCFRRREVLNRKFAGRLTLLGLTYGILVFPVAWPLLREVLAGQKYMYYGWKGGDVQVIGFWIKQTGTFLGLPVLLGYTAIVLSIVGIARFFRQRDVQFWLLAGLAFFILAMGPHPSIVSRSLDSVPLPFLLLYKLPVLGSARIANRYLVLTILAMSVLTGFALARGTGQGSRRSPAVLPWVAGGLIFLEFLAAPFARYQIQVPGFYRELGRDPGSYGVIDLPLSTVNSSYMYYQTVHQKKIAGGYIGRNVPAATEFMEEAPVFSVLSHPDRTPPTDEDQGPAAVAFLRDRQIRYLVVHRTFIETPREPVPALSRLSRIGQVLLPYSLNRGRAAFIPRFPDHPGFALTHQEYEHINSYLRALLGAPFRDDEQTVVYRVY